MRVDFSHSLFKNAFSVAPCSIGDNGELEIVGIGIRRRPWFVIGFYVFKNDLILSDYENG